MADSLSIISPAPPNEPPFPPRELKKESPGNPVVADMYAFVFADEEEDDDMYGLLLAEEDDAMSEGTPEKLDAEEAADDCC